MLKVYELSPAWNQNQQSFYGKAHIYVIKDWEYLMSYETIVASRNTKTGKIRRHWDGWSATTGRHIAAFCGLNKKCFEAIPYTEQKAFPFN